MKKQSKPGSRRRAPLFSRTTYDRPKLILNGRLWEFWFHEAVYGTDYVVVWNADEDLLTKYFKRRLGYIYNPSAGDLWAARTCAIDAGSHAGAQVIAFRKWCGGFEDIRNLAHECFHAAHNTLGSKGADFGNNPFTFTNEHYAYLIGWLTGVCYRALTSVKGVKR